MGNWLTPQRGGCIAAGVRGPFTGKGYSLGIIDDPYKGPEDANSAGAAAEADRVAPVGVAHPRRTGLGARRRRACARSAQVVVLTRWDHQDDDRLAAGAGAGGSPAALDGAGPAGDRRTRSSRSSCRPPAPSSRTGASPVSRSARSGSRWRSWSRSASAPAATGGRRSTSSGPARRRACCFNAPGSAPLRARLPPGPGQPTALCRVGARAAT